MSKLLNEGKEEIKRALLLMKYNTSKTLSENQETIKPLVKEDVGTTAAVGTGVGAGIGATLGYASLAPAGSAALIAAPTGLATVVPAVAGFLEIGTVAAASVVGAAVGLALVPLVYWLVRRDTGPAKQVQALFQMCSTTPNIEKLPRKLNDSEIRDIADSIYDAINYETWGFMAGTDEEKLFAAFKQIATGTASDVCALYKRYTLTRGELYDDLNSDIDSPNEWEQIYRPLRNCVEDSMVELAKMNPCKTGETPDPKDTSKCIPIDQLKIDGNKVDKIQVDCSKVTKKGCKNENVGKIQKCLNDFHSKNLVIDNTFGSRTESSLKDVIGSNEIQNSEIESKVCKTKGVSIPGLESPSELKKF